jgi:putative nucleotidyltransferase with HDIG domain
MTDALARAICGRLRAAGHDAYAVGGFVRDRILARPTGDLDLATSAHPDQVLELFPRAHPTGLQHGTVTVVEDGCPVEVTTFRSEGLYSDKRRPDAVRFVSSIEEDLKRRDFTVNAIAWDPLTDALIDPFDGLADLHDATLRCVGDAAVRFGEDALRLLRAVRFHATHLLMPAPGLEEAMGAAAPGLARIAVERIDRELSLLLERAERPSMGFEMALRCGLLPLVLPELLALVGQAQNRFHAFDCWEHTLVAVDAVPVGATTVRWAALLHDLGKPASAEEHPERPGEFRFFGHEKISVKQAEGVAERLRFSKRRRAAVIAMVATHMLHPTAEWSAAAIRRLLRRIGADGLDDYLALKRADVAAKGTPDVPEILRGVDEIERRLRAELDAGSAFSRKDLAVDGDQLCAALKRAPGRWLGTLLAALLERVIDDPELNDEARLIALAQELSEPS